METTLDLIKRERDKAEGDINKILNDLIGGRGVNIDLTFTSIEISTKCGKIYQASVAIEIII